MKEFIHIGKETFTIMETENGYEIRDVNNGTIYDTCGSEELNETIYCMIDRLCPMIV